MKKELFTVLSDFDQTELACTAVLPDTPPKAIVQIAHGMCEHSGRYQAFLEFLAGQGYVAAIGDHRGHGNSVKDNADLGYFNDKSGKAIVDDCAKITRVLKEHYGDLPVYLFGHSMGSLVVRAYLQKYENQIEKLIVCGSPSQNALVGAGIALTKATALFKGERYRSKTLHALTLDGDKRFPGEGPAAWLTRDRSVVENYLRDDKCGYIFTCNGYENLFRLLKHTYDGGRYAVNKPQMPILFVAGSDDPVIVSEEKWFAAQQSLRKAGYENVSGRLYHGMRHEILNEIGKEEVLADIAEFLAK